VEEQEQDLYYLEDVMVASSGSGMKLMGQVVDVEDVKDSLGWLQQMHKVGNREEYLSRCPQPEVEVEVPVVEESTVVETTPEVVDVDAVALIDKAKEVLSKGKKRLADLAVDCESTEAVLKPLLTKENGFLLNQQGWYSVQSVS
jgi:hypothetical protein